ncbi:MAG: FKBP-type peptidyl-prolyl cis-trans isomerase [Promethearchaeota archaeon]
MAKKKTKKDSTSSKTKDDNSGTTPEEDVIKEGDIIRVHVVGRVNSHEGPVFQVTDENVAREEGMLDDENKRTYEPWLVILGKGQIISGIEEALIGMKVGEEKKVEIPPEKAYGQVDPKKKTIMAFREFKRKFKKNPRRGDFVEMPNTHEQGKVIRVNQGKVFIDTNHVLAGRTLYYTLKVVEKLEGEDAKIKALIAERIPGIPDKEIEITKDDDALTLKFPNQALFAQQFGLMTYLLANELQREFDQYDKIKFIFEFEKTKPPDLGIKTDGMIGKDANTAEGDTNLESEESSDTKDSSADNDVLEEPVKEKEE